ncbi:NEMP family [Cinara cedri]|uniref:NEMP family n=1 Tax=Cinara cedri TaxID=506608 RepID=A0A5E4LZA0_9HEMI|nr:NEMP family [Cinara cedri]
MIKFYGMVCVTSLWLTFVIPVDPKPNTIQVNVDEIIECCSSKEKKYSLPPIYCYHSKTQSIFSIFQTIMVDLIIENTDEFEVYKVFDQNLVKKTVAELEEETTIFNQRISNFWKRQGFELDPFQLLPKRKPKLRFLSQNEYIYQGMIETPKALIELHKYCNRPDYDVWYAISRLREYKKFIKFMMTSDHITDTIKISEMETDDELGGITDLEIDGIHSDFIGDHKYIEYLLTSDDE